MQGSGSSPKVKNSLVCMMLQEEWMCRCSVMLEGCSVEALCGWSGGVGCIGSLERRSLFPVSPQGFSLDNYRKFSLTFRGPRVRGGVV